MIMGIDPGTKEITFVVLYDDGDFVCSSTVPVRDPDGERVSDSFVDCVRFLLTETFDGKEPFVILAVEGVYVGSNLRLAVELAQVVGMLQAVALICGIEFVEIAPAAGRKALTGNGQAGDRRAVQCACELTGWHAMPVHVADAMGVALAAREHLLKEREKEGEE